MNLHGPNLTRRSMLAGAASLGLAACTRMTAVKGETDPVSHLVGETLRQPRALRDGSLPYSDGGDGGLPDNSFDYRLTSAARSKEFARRARELRARTTDLEDAETLDVLIWDLDRDAALAPFYWHEFPLPYVAPETSFLTAQLPAAPRPQARPLYLSTLRQAPAFIDNIRLRLLGQLERGLTVPRAEAVRALDALVLAQTELMQRLNAVADRKVEGASFEPGFASDVQDVLRGPLSTSFDQLVQVLQHQYISRLDENSALARAGDAQAYHRELLTLRISGEYNPSEEHEAARHSLATIDRELSSMRRLLGGGADATSFHAALARDPRWLARDSEDVARRLQAAEKAIAPLLDRFFSHLPVTPCEVAPLPARLSSSLLNGYYQDPTLERPRGTYYFNTSGLDITSWLWATPLVAHELVPGHHLQSALLFETKEMSQYRKAFYIAGVGEGWSEYARRLMEEAGLYEADPWGLYASRLMDRRFALRSVVETGVHNPDWSWQEADVALASDPLTRPGSTRQIALAAATFRSAGIQYWRGLQRFFELRQAAENLKRPELDIREFHQVVMRGDVVPFSVLERRVRTWASGQSPSDPALLPGISA